MEPDFSLSVCSHDGHCGSDVHPSCYGTAISPGAFPYGHPPPHDTHYDHRKNYYDHDLNIQKHVKSGKISHSEAHKFERWFNHLTGKQKQAIIALGVGAALLIPGVGFAVSSTMTALTIGPLGEAIALEFFANSAFMYAATRAGLMVAGGRTLNAFGLFGYANIVDHTAIESIKGWTKERVLEKALSLGVATEKDKLLLWSGMGDGIKISQDFARANNLVTLEMTKGGRWLSNLNFDRHAMFTRTETRDIWKSVSLEAVRQAKGKISAIVGTFSPESIYAQEKIVADLTPAVTYIEEFSILPAIRHKR